MCTPTFTAKETIFRKEMNALKSELENFISKCTHRACEHKIDDIFYCHICEENFIRRTHETR